MSPRFVSLVVLACSLFAPSAFGGVFNKYVGSYSGTKIDGAGGTTINYPLTLKVTKSTQSGKGTYLGFQIASTIRFNNDGTLSGTGRIGPVSFIISGTYTKTGSSFSGTTTATFSNGTVESATFTDRFSAGKIVITGSGQLSTGTSTSARFVGRL